VAGFYDSVAVKSGLIAKRYLALDQAMVLGAIGNVFANDLVRRSFSSRQVEQRIRPLIAMEQFRIQPRITQETLYAAGRRTDWDERIALRSDEERAFDFPDLDPPKEVSAVGGVGQVTIDWSPVDGAVGYLILRATGDHGKLEPVDHHSGDVLSVPAPPHADTTCTPGTPYRYAVASVPEVTVTGRPSHAVGAVPLVADGTVPRVDVTVDTVC
jgi:hypothetical protein